MVLTELVDASLLDCELADEYAALAKVQEPKWRVKTLLHKRIADNAHGTEYVSKFTNIIDSVFNGLPKPKDWVSFPTNDLPLLFTSDEVQQLALTHRLNKAQCKTPLSCGHGI